DSAAVAALLWMIAMIAATLIAQPAAAPVMFVVCVMFAALNVTVERLLGAWVEKLLAKRRSREAFVSLFILAMISLQFLNPLMQKYGGGLVTVVRSWLPYLWLLPSSFAGDAVARSVQHQWAAAAFRLGALAVYVALCTALLWRRYAQLYSGEELSETAAPARKEKPAAISATDENEVLGFLPP